MRALIAGLVVMTTLACAQTQVVVGAPHMDDPNGCMHGMTMIDFPDQGTMLRTTLGFWVGNSRRNGEVLAWVPHVMGPLALTKYQGYVVRDNNGGSRFIITDLWTATGAHVPTRRVVNLFSQPCPQASASTGPDIVQPIPNLGGNPPVQGGVQTQAPLQGGVKENTTADTLTGDFWISVPGQPDQEVTVKISILSNYPRGKASRGGPVPRESEPASEFAQGGALSEYHDD
jgi:hypothetical protein